MEQSVLVLLARGLAIGPGSHTEGCRHASLCLPSMHLKLSSMKPMKQSGKGLKQEHIPIDRVQQGS